MCILISSGKSEKLVNNNNVTESAEINKDRSSRSNILSASAHQIIPDYHTPYLSQLRAKCEKKLESNNKSEEATGQENSSKQQGSTSSVSAVESADSTGTSGLDGGTTNSNKKAKEAEKITADGSSRQTVVSMTLQY